jgi:hypothetical protein
MSISRLSEALNRYDQYGIIRVNTFQTLYLTICIFLVNFIFGPPYMNQLLPIFMLGIIAAGSSPSYIRRQQIVIIFTVLAIIWYVCVNLVVNHNLATVIMNGFLLSLVYWLGKKIPIFAAIALVCYLLGAILPALKVSGSFYVYYNLIAICGLYLLITLAFMNLFPKVYYNRIWVRAFYLSLNELANIQRALAYGETNFANSKHLRGIYRITSGLTQKEFTFGARRVNISLLRIYTYMTTLRTKLLPINPQALLQSADLCDHLCKKIASGERVQASALQITDLPDGIKFALQQLIIVWNKTCLKV